MKIDTDMSTYDFVCLLIGVRKTGERYGWHSEIDLTDAISYVRERTDGYNKMLVRALLEEMRDSKIDADDEFEDDCHYAFADEGVAVYDDALPFQPTILWHDTDWDIDPDDVISICKKLGWYTDTTYNKVVEYLESKLNNDSVEVQQCWVGDWRSGLLSDKDNDRVFTDRAVKFLSKAIEKGWIEKTADGRLKWLKWNKNALGCFLYNVYMCGGFQAPRTALQKLFNVEALDSAIRQGGDAGKSIPYRVAMDEFFADDH